MIPYGRQSINSDDIEAVVAVLRSDFLTQGPTVERFEKAIAGYCGAPHAIAVSSATSALHLACLALNIGVGDRVWVSPNTFVATANCVRYCGGQVGFVDIDLGTLNMQVAALEAKLDRAAREGALPKAVIVTHFAGLPCDMAALGRLKDIYGFSLIEDAAHALGARLDDSPIGSCQFSDITVFSFHPVKIITTGEGGVATTQDERLADRMRLFRSHGVTRSTEDMRERHLGNWYYEQLVLGFNYRMTDIQAALGISQLSRIEGWIERRHVLADVYDRTLRELPLILPAHPRTPRSALHLYPVQIDPTRTSLTRREVFDALREAGIGVNVHYIPVHTQPYYRDLGHIGGECPNAELYYAHCLSLPMFASLTDDDQHRVVTEVRRALKA